tara:strand:+ start:1503 stop:1850 length:348 start_codon:yes stop_codon:yes gene_type:complete
METIGEVTMSWKNILKNVFGFGSPKQDNDLELNIMRLKSIISKFEALPKKYVYPIDSDTLESFQNALERVLRNMPNPPQIKAKNYDKTISIVQDYIETLSFEQSNRIIRDSDLFQ